jgi:hypothetical protein
MFAAIGNIGALAGSSGRSYHSSESAREPGTNRRAGDYRPVLSVFRREYSHLLFARQLLFHPSTTTKPAPRAPEPTLPSDIPKTLHAAKTLLKLFCVAKYVLAKGLYPFLGDEEDLLKELSVIDSIFPFPDPSKD